MQQITATIDVLDGFEDNFDPTAYETVLAATGRDAYVEVIGATIDAVDRVPAPLRTQAQRVQAHILGLGQASGLTVLNLRSRRRADLDAQARHDAYLRDELAAIDWHGDRPVDDYFAFGRRVPFDEATVDTAPWIEVGA